MFIRRISEKYQLSKKVEEILLEIENISKNHSIINLSASPTGGAWLGVFNAGLSLFPTNTVALPQYYSNQILTQKQLAIIGQKIGTFKFEQLIFNGFNEYFIEIIKSARQVNPKIKIGVVYHGFYAELTGNRIGQNILKSLLSAYDQKLIDKLGFAKTGFSELMNNLKGVNAFQIYYQNPIIQLDKIVTKKQIGVLTGNDFRKNTYTQVLAAQVLRDYTTVVLSNDEFDFFLSRKNIVSYSNMKHSEFLALMAESYINSHVTYSEASGGQVFTESLALGVPCLTSLTHGYLDDSEILKKALVVDRFDDAWAIAQKMEEVIAQRDYLSQIGLEYSRQMNLKAESQLKVFLEN
jgi:hypothetical protein